MPIEVVLCNDDKLHVPLGTPLEIIRLSAFCCELFYFQGNIKASIIVARQSAVC